MQLAIRPRSIGGALDEFIFGRRIYPIHVIAALAAATHQAASSGSANDRVGVDGRQTGPPLQCAREHVGRVQHALLQRSVNLTRRGVIGTTIKTNWTRTERCIEAAAALVPI